MTEFLHQAPPDDTGTDTLQRYRYQAQVAVPFCIGCVDSTKVRSVIMEHFEDIVVEYPDHWHFIQVKTRNSELGPWKISDTFGGLKSLYRTYHHSSKLKAKYSLYLEGAIRKKDDLQVLKNPSRKLTKTLISKISNALEIEEDICEEFLKFVTVVSDQPGRDTITDRNITLMGELAPHISVSEISSIEKRLVDKVLSAMSAERLESLLYLFISDANSLGENDEKKVRAKRLDSDVISTILGSLALGKAPLLKGVEIQDNKPLTKLEQKMVAGGATVRIINQAKELRANATIREAEFLASDLCGDERLLEDVQLRLRTEANAIVEQHDEEEKPAKKVWKALLDELERKKSSVDPNRVYLQDHYLLLGAVCDLSDQCLVDWGVPVA